MRKEKGFILLLAVVVICVGTITWMNKKTSKSATSQPLRVLAEELRKTGREFYIGCAVPSNFNSGDQEIVKKEFDMVTCENDMKIGTISPSANQYNYSGGDRLVSFAESNKMVVHGHAFVWHKYNPYWVDGTKSMMETYINAVGTHFKGKIYAWDVVNESFQKDGTYRINSIGSGGQDGASVFGQKQTKQYIEDAFIAARKVDSKAKLIYNDYDLETRDAKFDAVYKMVKDFKERKIPIDGVGFQMHLGPSFTKADADSFAEKMQRLADIGVESYVTEMDVGCNDNSQDGLDKQAEIYGWIAKACIEQPYCRALQIWGIRDSQSWRINPDDPVDKAIAPLIFNDNGERKPAYYAIQKVLEEALSTPTVNPIVEGDANGDGTFDVLDLATFKKAILGTEPSYKFWKEATDFNKDGVNDVLDLAIMKKKLLGK